MEALCTGPVGHIPAIVRVGTDGLAIVPRYRAPIPGFSDVLLEAEAAAVGNPCVGTFATEDEDGVPLGSAHVRMIRTRFQRPDLTAPRAIISAFRTDDGQVRTGLMDIAVPALLPLDRATRLIEAWQTALTVGRFSIEGRPLGTGTFRDAAHFFAVLDPIMVTLLRTRAATQKQVADALAEQPEYLNVNEQTVRDWFSRYKTEHKPPFKNWDAYRGTLRRRFAGDL